MHFILYVGAYIYLFSPSLFINEMRPSQKNKAGGAWSVCSRERKRKFGHLLVHSGWNRVSIPHLILLYWRSVALFHVNLWIFI